MSFGSTDHTFVVCAYKESPYLRECVQSIINQSVSANVLIATSTPADHITSVAQDFHVPLFVRDGVPSIADDWNYAISCAQTPLVTVAHQDDTYERDYTQHMLSAVNSVELPLIFFTNYGELRKGEKKWEETDGSRLLDIKRKLLAPLRDGRRATNRFVRRRILSVGCPICCPSVTLCRPNLPNPAFRGVMKCDLDWDAWERFSRSKGAFYYDSSILMHHRIHKGSETTALIEDNTRTNEDFEMIKRFWPTAIARIINGFYSHSQKSNKT